MSLDKVIETMCMKLGAGDMNAKYQETSRGGLAIKCSVTKFSFRPSATMGEFSSRLVASRIPHYTVTAGGLAFPAGA